jgi:hypothetical protein
MALISTIELSTKFSSFLLPFFFVLESRWCNRDQESLHIMNKQTQCKICQYIYDTNAILSVAFCVVHEFI